MGTTFGNSITPLVNTSGLVIPISANTTLSGLSWNRAHLISGTGNFTINLPLLSAGKASDEFTIMNDTATGTSTLAAQGSDNIRVNGANVTTLSLLPGDAVTFEHNGSALSLKSTNPLKAPLASPAFTGTPSAPTAAQNVNTTQIATTAFVLGQAASTNPTAVGIVQAGSGTTFSRADHVHPNTAPTATVGDNSTTIATTAFVAGQTKQIFSITATVAANAMTITLNPCSIDFRSTTLGSGAVTTVTVASPISITVPSGATLGAVNGQLQRIMVYALNNAGTVELGVAGWGTGTEESATYSIILDTASDGSYALYSTTARTNVAFRAVGYIDSTQATAGTYATTPSLVQGIGGLAGSTISGLGYSQTWQNVTGSRAAATTYYNTTGRPIFVNVSIDATAQSFASATVGGVVMDGSMVGTVGQPQGVSFIVPPGNAYSVASTNGTVIRHWAELR